MVVPCDAAGECWPREVNEPSLGRLVSLHTYVIPKGTRCKICRAHMSERWRSYSTRKRLVFQNYNRARYGEYMFHARKWLIWLDARFVEREG